MIMHPFTNVKRLLQHLINEGYILASWKIGIVTFLPKLDKPEIMAAYNHLAHCKQDHWEDNLRQC